jgi:hypothetical protein
MKIFKHLDRKFIINFSIDKNTLERNRLWIGRNSLTLIVLILSAISIYSFIYYYQNGLGLAYNDARSHLDIGRRVVEGLNTGVAQLGSVWLPLTHILMTLTIWNDFMWHSGLAGAIQSMVAFIGTGILIYLFLKELSVGLFGRIIGLIVFAANINILYLQSTAMTELVLIGTMTAGVYYLLRWTKTDGLNYLIYAAFWIMLSTLVRYDGWFLLFLSACFVFIRYLKLKGYRVAEGIIIIFCTLGGLGIALWLLWNLLIFKDPLYFAFGPYSAFSQQKQLDLAGILATKDNWLFSSQIYFYALTYNSGAFTVILGFIGSILIFFDKKFSFSMRIATLILLTPLIFNILALYLGHSVLYVAGLSGETWFNIRYGIMMAPSFAIFIGYLSNRVEKLKILLMGFILFLAFFTFSSNDAVTIDDARVGSSQKNVTEVSEWLKENTENTPGFILISVASHDAIIFSSGLQMKKFIHEGSGSYYDAALKNTDHWARWIVMRTYSNEDSTWKAMKNNPAFKNYELVGHYPFADIYQLRDEYLIELNTKPILKPNNDN